MDAPTAAGHVTAEGGTVSDIDVTRADADVAYADGMLSFQNLAAETFGGNISGEGTLSAADLSYAAHLKIEGLSLDRLRTDAQLPLPADLSGTLSADLGIGTGWDVSCRADRARECVLFPARPGFGD